MKNADNPYEGKPLYYWRKERKLCVVCGKERARKNRVSCAECAARDTERKRGKAIPKERIDRNKETQKVLYEARKAAGLCTRCGRRALPDKTQCGLCRAKNQECARKRRLAEGRTPRVLMGNGQWCHLCGKPTQNGAKECPACLEKMRACIARTRAAKTKKNYFEQANEWFWARNHPQLGKGQRHEGQQ